MVSPEEHYKRVCAQIDRYHDRQETSFARFVQLSLATVGGFLWLKMQDNVEQVEHLFALVRWIIPALALITVIEIFMLHIVWCGFRRAEAELLERPDLYPKWPRAWRREMFQSVTVAVIGAAGFVWLR